MSSGALRSTKTSHEKFGAVWTLDLTLPEARNICAAQALSLCHFEGMDLIDDRYVRDPIACARATVSSSSNSNGHQPLVRPSIRQSRKSDIDWPPSR